MQMTNFKVETSNELPMVDSSGTGRNCARRDSRWKEGSKDSILSSMDKFVRTVEDMNETILVPCRLMDMKVSEHGEQLGENNRSDPQQVNDGRDPRARKLLRDMGSSDLFAFYTMLNSVKNELLWGSRSQESDKELAHVVSGPAASSSGGSSSSSSSEVKGHARRPSTVSMTSSTSVSDTDSEASNENDDSGVENEEDYAVQVGDTFRRHLHGLHQCLRELTAAAEFVTSRYQQDVGGSV